MKTRTTPPIAFGWLLLLSMGACDAPQPQKAQPQTQVNNSPSVSSTMTIADWSKWTPSEFFDSSNELELCQAISSGDIAKLKSLLDAGAELNTPGKFGLTVLYWAFIELDMKAFQLLLEHGADPDRVLTEDIAAHSRYNVFLAGDTVLFTSSRCFKSQFCTAALPYSRNVHRLDRSKNNLLHAFLYHGYGFSGEKHLKALIDAGIDLNAKGSFTYPPSHIALSITNPKLCLQLLESGADPGIQNGAGRDLADILEATLSREKPGEHDIRLDPIVAWLDENYRKIRWTKR